MKKRLIISLVIVVLVSITISGCGKKRPTKVVFETNIGNIEMEIYPWLAPKNSSNVLTLIKDGFYDGKRFHRVVNGEVIQTGAFKKGSKSMDVLDYNIPDEINPEDLELTDEYVEQLTGGGFTFNYDVRSIPLRYGVVAMANRGPNTNQSQIFIVTNPNGIQYLNGRYTAFGQVTGGVDVVIAIDSYETDKFDEPLEEVYIEKAYIK
ncbi:MAG: peptidylprolyl isomerase [Caldisericia bacterium]|nr:peptidylprolyl isomerase [Caldisericia bacterium]